MGERYKYRPELPEDLWLAVGPYVKDVVDRAVPLTPYDAGQLYPAITLLAVFAFRAGLPLGDDHVLDSSTIERLVHHNLESYTRASRNTLRSRMRRVSEALLGQHDSASFAPLGKADPSQPYTPVEITWFRLWAAHQSTEEARTTAAALLALGFGAGLSTAEIVRARVDDLASDGAGLSVRVHAPRERVTPVSVVWSDVLLRRAEFLGGRGWLFRSRQTGGNRNLVADFAARHGAGTLQTRRMRATWLVDHLNAGTPVRRLLAMAGLSSAEALDSLLPFTEP